MYSLTHSVEQSLLEKLVVLQLLKKFPTFYESKGLLPCSQEHASGPCSEPS
jgi:hypothetical protein